MYNNQVKSEQTQRNMEKICSPELNLHPVTREAKQYIEVGQKCLPEWTKRGVTLKPKSLSLVLPSH